MPLQTFFNLPEPKRQAIIDLAIDEFAEHDFPSASISRIVSRAGIAKGSFYQYFADKKDLFLYLLDLAGHEKMRFVQGLQPPDPRMGLFPYLRWMMEVGSTFRLSNPKLEQVVYRALYSDSGTWLEAISRLREQTDAYYRHLVQLGMQQGDVDPAYDPELVAFVLSTLTTELGKHVMTRLQVEPAQSVTREYVAKAAPLLSEVVHMLEHGLHRK
ncbi:MAG TPA: TetR/AcrR family transcriptional regulator [Symbiobacteriaceae bacterium]|nr:TetR/AcrR family transcriptional regulator [Symbiobacteriaceae bacterium]